MRTKLSTRMFLMERDINWALADNTIFMMKLESGRLSIPKLGTAAALVLMAEDGHRTTAKQRRRARQYVNRHGLDN